MNRENLFFQENTKTNPLLKGPELISPEKEQTEKIEMTFSFSSETRQYYIGHSNGKSFFMVKYFDSLPNDLSEKEREQFKKETDPETKKTVYTLKYGEIPEQKESMTEPAPSQNKSYRIAQARDFEKNIIDNFISNDQNKQIMINILKKYLNLTPEEISQLVEHLFNDYHTTNSEAIQTFSNPFTPEIAEKIRVEIRELMLPKPQNIDTTALIEILKNKKVLFYTGAGISKASKVHDMNQLKQTLGIAMSEQVDNFLKKATANPKEIVEAWEEFIKAAFANPATPAHQSLGNIAKQLNAQIFTENIDHLQEKTGVKPTHLTGPWLKENIKPEWLKDIDVIITAGLSYDDRGFLGWYKENNPNGKIIAIDVNQPSYLGNEDFLLKGDCQKVLPELENNLQIL